MCRCDCNDGTFVFQLQAPAKAIYNISCIFILLCVPMRFLRLEGPEQVLLSCACPMSWFFVLFFLRFATIYDHQPKLELKHYVVMRVSYLQSSSGFPECLIFL